MNPKTKEWKDGVLSTMMRDMAKNQGGKFTAQQKYKWVVLDGDVDPMWIESMNTVMDDNKCLTLVSQERIPLTAAMRLILEVSHLKQATPATVSRGGVLFINETDIGWRPMWDSWLQKFKGIDEKENAYTTFVLNLTTYCDENFLEDIKRRSTVAPMCLMAYFQSLMTIIDFLYEEHKTLKSYTDHFKKLKDGAEADKAELLSKYAVAHGNNLTYDDIKKLIYEGMFVFAMIWSFGAALDDQRGAFSNMLKGKSSKIKFPDIQNSQVYDFKFNMFTATWEQWSQTTPPMDKEFDGLYSNLIVPTIETQRQTRLIDIHKQSKRGLFYCGIAGTGKTTILKNYFATMNKEELQSATVNFNSYTDSLAFQVVLEGKIQKRYGRLFGPPPGYKLLFFIDDINMPKVDDYGTQQPISLIRQIVDYKLMYDRSALSEQKTVEDVMFMACMNPKSGSFFIDLRLQRHFTTVALPLPDKDKLKDMYKQILDNHFHNFDQVCKDSASIIVEATATVFTSITLDKTLLPTATKFHY